MTHQRDDRPSGVHGIAAVFAALAGLFARSADDVARIGVHAVDDFGRACATSTDDFGRLMSRSGDDFFRQVDDFHGANYVDELRFDLASTKNVADEVEEGVFIAPHVARRVAEVTLRAAELSNRNNDK